MSFFNYLEDATLDHILGKTPYTSPTVYIGLSTTTPGDDGTSITEPSTGAYARVTTSGATWTASSAGATSNAAAVTFAAATADWSAGADMTYLVAFDAITVGNELYWGLLSVAKPVLDGDTASFPIGNINLTLD